MGMSLRVIENRMNSGRLNYFCARWTAGQSLFSKLEQATSRNFRARDGCEEGAINVESNLESMSLRRAKFRLTFGTDGIELPELPKDPAR